MKDCNRKLGNDGNEEDLHKNHYEVTEQKKQMEHQHWQLTRDMQ